MRLPLPQFSTENRPPEHIAEAIETSTTEFVAQCLDPEDLSFPAMPPFGSWVKSMDEESGNKVYAVVTHVTTTPIDSVHRARALGLSLEELREQQPQIFAMLKTEFRAAIVGFETPPLNRDRVNSNSTNNNGVSSNRFSDSLSSNPSNDSLSSNRFSDSERGKLYQYLPPRPPQIHQAVYRCEPSEVIAFSEELDFLRILLQVKSVPVEALIAAAVREIYRLRNADRAWLVKTGRTLSILLKDDYDCLRYILSQIHW